MKQTHSPHSQKTQIEMSYITSTSNDVKRSTFFHIETFSVKYIQLEAT